MKLIYLHVPAEYLNACSLFLSLVITYVFWFMQDPILRNLESRFALQQKIVEAAKKLANEPELCKTVKKKRRRNCLDAMQKLQQIEDEMNQYRIKKGKKPTQRSSVIIAGTLEDICYWMC